MATKVYRITSPYLCAALGVNRGIVVFTAPILRWAHGKPWDEVSAWMAKKKWTMELLGTEEEVYVAEK